MQKIIKRLELIKNSIALEDEDVIELQLSRLKEMELDVSVMEIITAIHRREFSSVIDDIDRYVARFSGMVIYEDGELYGLRLELKVLEGQVENLSDQKNDLQFQVDQFNYHYQLELGQLIKDILSIREEIQSAKIFQKEQVFKQQADAYRELKDEVDAIKADKVELEKELEQCDVFSDEYDQLYENIRQAEKELNQKEELLHQHRKQAKAAKEELEESQEYKEYKDAQDEHEQFEQHYQEVVTEDSVVLSDTDEHELKQAYKKAARLCHPDLVDDDLKEQATIMMQALNDAKKKQNLLVVKEILHKLQSGQGFAVASDTITDRKLLRAKIDQIRQTIEQFEVDILEIQLSESWKSLAEIEDLGEYFSELKVQLEDEYIKLQDQLSELKRTQIEKEDQAIIDKANWEFEEIQQSHKSHSGVSPEDMNDYFTKNPPDDEDEYWRQEF
jgi:myosin heavy subunit